MTNGAIVNKNSDFLFIYEAIMCNPNGDPDQENKPRMDYETKTNLVSDVRIKRYIRDYLKTQGKQIFVDMDGDRKVSAETKLNIIVEQSMGNNETFNKLIETNPEIKVFWENLISKVPQDKSKDYKTLKSLYNNSDFKKNNKDFKNDFDKFNNMVLIALVNLQLIDIRMFGGAFAVGGFSKTFTGPIQINWGYSFNKVELIKSNSIVTIMNDDNSTFGDDHRVYYSLLGFHGSVNKYFANQTGLTESDLNDFRHSIYEAIPALPTRSKLEQYPALYFEIQYKKEYNGYLKDLRSYVDFSSKVEQEEKIRQFKDVDLNLDKLINLVNTNKAIIEKVYIAKNEFCYLDETKLQVPVEIINPYPMLV